MGWFEENKNVLQSVIVFALISAGLWLALPSTIDDTSKPSLFNPATNQAVPQQKINMTLIYAYFLLALGLVIYNLLASRIKPSARRRDIIDVIGDFTIAQKTKLGLKDIEQTDLQEASIYQTTEANIDLAHMKNCNGEPLWMLYDTMEDWNVRVKRSPYMNHTFEDLAYETAMSRLLKRRYDPLRFVKQAQGLGFTPEETRKQLLEKRLEEEEAKRKAAERAALQGDISEN